MAIQVLTAQLLGSFLETLGFGVYLVVGPQAFLVVRQKRLGKGLTIYLYSTIILTSIFMIFHLVIDLIRTFIAFTTNTGTPYAPEAFYANVDATLTYAKVAGVVATALVADILIIHRTLIVWGRRWWLLILLVGLYCIDVGTSIWCVWSTTEAEGKSSVLNTTVYTRSKYFFAATLAVNLVCTCFIAYRIWSIQNAVSKYISAHHRVRNALSIVLESAAIYTADLVCMLVLERLHSAALFVFLDSMPPLIGLVFTYVILRSSSEDDRYNSDKISSELKSNDMTKSVTNIERIDLKPTRRFSEGVHIHFETISHHDAEHHHV